MSILIDKNTRVLMQGITGSAGSFHAGQMLDYGTKLVAGVTPGKGGTVPGQGPHLQHRGRRGEADRGQRQRGLRASAVRRRRHPRGRGRRCPLVIVITEGIPVLDMVKVKRALQGRPVRLVGPNCPGVITPGAKCKIGIMPGHIHRPGRIGVVSRSGTLTYEAVFQLTQLGLGQSTAVGIGGDPVNGTDFVDCLKLFNADPETDAVIMIGEIGGSAEETAAQYIGKEFKKPIAGFIAGVSAPPGKRMGHAGAIIAGGKGTAAEKIRAMEAAGVLMAPSPAELGTTLQAALQRGRTR